VHPLRHSIHTAFLWVFLHLPLTASLLAGGHAASSATTKEFHHPEIWLLCAGLGTGLICLWVIACLNSCEDAPGTLILPKPARLVFRPIVAVIIICLPLAHDLDITSVMSIIMALLVFCVVWENITSLMRGAKFWESWEGTEYPKSSDNLSRLGEA